MAKIMRTSNKLNIILLLVICIMIGIDSLGQPPGSGVGPAGGGPPGSGGLPGQPCWPPPCVPVDSGIYIITTIGLIFGFIKLIITRR